MRILALILCASFVSTCLALSPSVLVNGRMSGGPKVGPVNALPCNIGGTTAAEHNFVITPYPENILMRPGMSVISTVVVSSLDPGREIVDITAVFSTINFTLITSPTTISQQVTVIPPVSDSLRASIQPSRVVLFLGTPAIVQLNVTASPYAMPGYYSLILTGESKYATRCVVTLSVNVVSTGSVFSPLFSVSAYPSYLTIDRYSPGRFIVTVQALNGFSGTVTWGLYGSDWPATGLDCVESPYSVAFGNSVTTVTLTSTCSPTTPGTFHVGVYLCPLASPTCTYRSSASLVTLTVIKSSTPPQPDFDLSASSSGQVTTGQSFTATIVVTARNSFSGRVIIAGAFPGGLLCGTIIPPFVNSSGTAKFSCSSQTPGTYAIRLTAFAVCTNSTYSGPCSRTTQLTVAVVDDILGPVYLYGGIGALVAVIETITRASLGRMRNPIRKSNSAFSLLPKCISPLSTRHPVHGRDC